MTSSMLFITAFLLMFCEGILLKEFGLSLKQVFIIILFTIMYGLLIILSGSVKNVDGK